MNSSNNHPDCCNCFLCYYGDRSTIDVYGNPQPEIYQNASGSYCGPISVVPDPVNHPSHYNQGKYEVIDVILDWSLDFLAGNVIKYIARAKHKGNELEDLKKARFYLEKLIERKENDE